LRLEPAEVSEAKWIRPDDFEELEPTFEADVRFFREILPTLWGSWSAEERLSRR
jgi:hypothetical protein